MLKNNFVPKIPYGTKDFLINEAEKKRVIETRIAELFSRWGYKEVITPTFEYLEIFDSNTSDKQALKFLDRKGDVLALRPDMTFPIARLASTRLREMPKPKRLSYIANVFRHEDAQAGRQCEFYQAGVELFGSFSVAADAEIIALAIEGIKKTGLDNFKISIGHVGFLNGVIDNADLTEKEKFKIRSLLSGRDLAGLEMYLKALPLPNNLQKCLQEVLFLQGGKEILKRASVMADNEKSEEALANLQAIYEMLEIYQVADNVDFDLGLIRNFNYYTGMVFEGYTIGMGFPICGGGRYDSMMESFGEDCPAVGFAIGVDRLLLAVERSAKKENEPETVYIAWADGCFKKAIVLAGKLREEGKNVEVSFVSQIKEDVFKDSVGKNLIYLES